MDCNIPARVLRDICAYARAHSVERVLLFGSRARGTNGERSDIDIAVYGGDFASFYEDVKEKSHSLLMFDVIDGNGKMSEELRAEIAREGIVIYEKA